MKNESVKITKKQAAKILAVSFPEYSGRKIRVEFAETVTFYDTNWGGGSRNSYVAIRADGFVGKLSAPAPWVNPVEGMTVPVSPEILIVEHSIFCGKDVGITIYANPIHLPKWIPSGK